MKLKQFTNKDVLRRQEIAKECSSKQYISFSFQYLTTSKNYNLSSIKNDDQQVSSKNAQGLILKLAELSCNEWKYVLGQRTANGFETMNYRDIGFEPKGKKLSPDEKVYIVRFDTYQGSKKGRIIGFKESPCATFYIIGIDTDFSAYNHGS